jgi:hypothetical protein
LLTAARRARLRRRNDVPRRSNPPPISVVDRDVVDVEADRFGATRHCAMPAACVGAHTAALPWIHAVAFCGYSACAIRYAVLDVDRHRLFVGTPSSRMTLVPSRAAYDTTRQRVAVDRAR